MASLRFKQTIRWHNALYFSAYVLSHNVCPLETLSPGLLAVGIGLACFTVPSIDQPTGAQTQNSQAEELLQLLTQAAQQTQQGQPQQASATFATFQQALTLA